MVAKWRRHGTAEISAVGPVGKESNNIWTPVTMALTNRGLGLEDFRPERSAAGSPMCTSTLPASLCHYYRGTFLTVSIAVDNILSTLPPLCRPRRSQLDDQQLVPPMISWLIRSIHLSSVFSSLLGNSGSVYLMPDVNLSIIRIDLSKISHE